MAESGCAQLYTPSKDVSEDNYRTPESEQSMLQLRLKKGISQTQVRIIKPRVSLISKMAAG
jgi:hypothetical protein